MPPEPSATRRSTESAPAPGQVPDLIATDGPQRGTVTRVVLVLASVVFFALGIAFWLIPVVTGVPFLVLSAVTAGMASRNVARWINRHEARLPERYRLWLRPKLRKQRRRSGAA